MPEAHTRGDILVVDDEPTIGDVVARYLERAGYATRVAGDGDRALELHGERAADLIVLDLMLPGVDGLEVMRRIRRDRTRRPAFILLTAKGEESDRIVGLRLGEITLDAPIAETTHEEVMTCMTMGASARR